MKKAIIAFFVLLTFFVFSPIALAGANGFRHNKNNSFIMPASLVIVEEKAFEGTAVRTVVFPVGLISIGECAFANSHGLDDIYIPSTVEFIGNNAFSSNKRITIHGVIGSLAETWAKEHQIPFAPFNIWNMVDKRRCEDNYKSNSAVGFYQASNCETLRHMHGRTEDDGRSMRPQERPELNPIDYRFP